MHITASRLYWPFKAFNLSVTFLSPLSLSSHQPHHGQFLSPRFISFMLRYPDITTPPPSSLLPLHYVIMIIAHRGLRKLNFPFRSGSFIPAVSLCATPHHHPTILCRPGVCRFGLLIKYILNVCLRVFRPFPPKIEK